MRGRDAIDSPSSRYQEMVARAAVAVGDTDTATIALGAAGVHELLDEVTDLRQHEHFLITHELKKGDVRQLVRQLVGLTRLHMNPVLSESMHTQIAHELELVLRRADRALGVER